MRMHDTMGIDRGILVHANTHGLDNRPFLEAVARSEGRYVGVVRLNDSATKRYCRDLHAVGVRGVRFAFHPEHGGALDHGITRHVLACIEDLGWFVDLHLPSNMLVALKDWISEISVNVVIDHFGRIDVRHGVDQRPFRVLLDLASRGNVWVKISGADRISAAKRDFADVEPYVRRLIRHAPNRILWGTDWPHTGYFSDDHVPDDGRLVDALAAFVSEESMLNRILVANPEQLLALTSSSPVLVNPTRRR